jgi:LysM repeat protein
VFDVSAGDPAKNVVILAGIGVAHAHGAAALAAVAERFAIPVATTLGAKGVLAENHPFSLGVFGYGGSRWATEAVLDPAVEVLIVLGSALSQRDTLQWNRKMLPSRELIHVDADPSLIGRTWPASVPVTASPRLFLEHLAAVNGPVAEGLEDGMATRRAFLTAIRDRGPRSYEKENTGSDADPMHPARMVSAARAACPPGTVLGAAESDGCAICDSGWQFSAPRITLFVPARAVERQEPTLLIAATKPGRSQMSRLFALAAFVIVVAAIVFAVKAPLQITGTHHNSSRSGRSSGRRLPPYWTVHSGQTLTDISLRTGLTVSQLQTYNPNVNPQELLPGERLNLWRHPPTQRRRAKPLGPRFWTVRPGDSLGLIAAKTGVNLARLEELNPHFRAILQPGDRVRLRR